MQRQMSFGDVEYSSKRQVTKREAFLSRMEAAVPWSEWLPIAEAAWHEPGGRGRPPVAAERMLRMYLLQLWYDLSDAGCEDACCDSRAFASFLGVRFGAGDQVPDSTTLCKFRHAMEAAGAGPAMLASLDALLEAEGVMMRGGSIVDATFVEAPGSVKNAGRERDPEMAHGKKGNVWHFGMKAHVGVDAGSGLVHAVTATPANVADVCEAHRLLRQDDRFCYADSGYAGVWKRAEVAGDPLLSRVEWRVAARPSSLRAPNGGTPPAERHAEWRKAAVRGKVEHVFLIVKRQFGYARCRFRGIAKNLERVTTLCALANLALVDRAGRRLSWMPA